MLCVAVSEDATTVKLAMKQFF